MTSTSQKEDERHALRSSLATSTTRRAGWLIPLVAILIAALPASSTAAALFGSSTITTTTTKQSVTTTTHVTLDRIEATVVTTAPQDFSRDNNAFVAASNWQKQRLHDTNQPGPYLVCGIYGRGGEARSNLESAFSPSSVRTVSHTEANGVCFVVTASPTDAEALLSDPSTFGLHSAVPFLPTMKLAPGLLSSPEFEVLDDDGNKEPFVLQTRHGENMRLDGVRGLTVGLSPGLTLSDGDARTLTDEWSAELMSESLDLWSTSIWSDPDMLEGECGHLSHPGGRLQAREWSRAMEVVHDLAASHGTSAGEVCAWDRLDMHLMGDNSVISVTGINHLLYTDETSETQVACFMGLLSFLASKPEVLRVSPLHGSRVQNAVASSILQGASVTGTPLHDAGLDGSGEVIQIVDSGLDETSCFFIDEDGQEIEHGHLYRIDPAVDSASTSSSGGFIVDKYFPFDLTRRKVVQYIALLDAAELPASSSSPFDLDLAQGHGTHTAGTAAGATISRVNNVEPCMVTGELPGCVGKCLLPANATADIENSMFDIDTYCPAYDCDGDGAASADCLGDDPDETLSQHGGVAPGAKLAIFDVSSNGQNVLAGYAGNDLWFATTGTGSKLHSNSWGSDSLCEIGEREILYDAFMYENPQNLLLFSAGNDGGYKDDPERTSCTIGSPALAKNVLTVGATSTGSSRSPDTGSDGKLRYEQFGATDYEPDGSPYIGEYPELGLPSTSSLAADIDIIAYFSSYGPTMDQRIKPEIVAPGDKVFSASSDGSDGGSCMLTAMSGTSMACPLVAGGAALVRQYFTDESFYVQDLGARGLCLGSYSSSGCNNIAFAPSAATVKAMLINSAHLMGGSAEPNNLRGFGRVHLEAGMPLSGAGDAALFVSDSSTTALAEFTQDSYTFNVDGSVGLELRATLSWIDPPATILSTQQLVHDLDLEVTSPDGTVYTVWESGIADTVNVNERVVVPAAAVSDGVWTVTVSAKALVATTTQSYSVVVIGAISW